MRTKPRVGRIAAPLKRGDGAMLAAKTESEHAGIVKRGRLKSPGIDDLVLLLGQGITGNGLVGRFGQPPTLVPFQMLAIPLATTFLKFLLI